MNEKNLVQNSDSWYKSVVELSPTIILIHNPEKIVYANPAASKFIKGNSTADLINKSIFDFLDENSKKKLLINLQGIKEGKRGSRFEEYNVIRMDGKVVVAEVLGTQIIFEGEPAVLVVGKDVTERKRFEEKIKQIAYHDSLTGLINRHYLTECIEESMKEAVSNRQKLAILFIDLDEFKIINDTHGHEMGDSLLKVVSKRLLNEVRKHDTVARWGGDEFIILLKDITFDETKQIVKRIIQSINDPVSLSGNLTSVTPSIGISLFPSDGLKPEILIKHADLAMYKAKSKGKNNFEFYN